MGPICLYRMSTSGSLKHTMSSEFLRTSVIRLSVRGTAPAPSSAFCSAALASKFFSAVWSGSDERPSPMSPNGALLVQTPSQFALRWGRADRSVLAIWKPHAGRETRDPEGKPSLSECHSWNNQAGLAQDMLREDAIHRHGRHA